MHAQQIDLTDDVLNCWDCHRVISQEESEPRLRLEAPSGACYLICWGCADASSALSPPPDTLRFSGDMCPVCYGQDELEATSCGHTLCSECLSSLKRPGGISERTDNPAVCPMCRGPLGTTHPIHARHCGVERFLPAPGTTGLTNVFRIGELVWYEHTSWELGVILSIAAKPGTTAVPYATDCHYNFTLAPLGHSMVERANVVKDCQFMRPFLMLPLPAPIDGYFRDKTFNKVDWRAMKALCMRNPDPDNVARTLQILGVEASRLGARAINGSFSTFNLHSQGATPDGTIHVKGYKGVYLGAEVVYVGDAVRVEIGTTTTPQVGPSPMTRSTTLVMLVKNIQVVETFQQHSCSALHFGGDVYRAVRSHSAQKDTVCDQLLGPAFVEELSTLNTLESDRSMRWRWVRILSREVCGAQNVLGRFYGTKGMRAVDPKKYHVSAEQGLVVEENYFDSWEKRERQPGRAATLGKAVSTHFRIPDGIHEDEPAK